MRRTAATLLVAALVMLAGCAGGIAGPDAGATTDASTDSAADSGNVQFYVSDEVNAIDQFEHLNVTVTSVGFAQAGAGDANETEAESESEVEVENESEGGLAVALAENLTLGENATVQVTYEGEPAANVSADVQVGDRDATVTTDANGTATVSVPENATEFSVEAETAENGTYGAGEASFDVEVETESESDDDDDESDGGWVERDVDERTVDLTELQGANATALGNLSVPEGDYEKVFVHVDEVNGTLQTGEEVNVKLPSQKLQLNEDFTVGNGESVDFVFDITVFEAGGSGKFILKPVASESGTDVPIVDVDEESELDVSVVGNATAGENATVQVTRGGEPVENATLEADDSDVSVTTGANGTATVPVPADGDLELEASYEREDGDTEVEAEGELELELGESGDNDDSDAGNGDDDDSDDSDTSAGAEADLAVVYEGTFAAGETVTLTVTDGEGEAVEDATVELDGEVVGETDENGELAVELPDDVSMNSQLTVTDDGESVTVDASTVAAAN